MHKRRTGHRGAFTGEAGGAEGLYLSEKSAVQWKLHLHVRSGIQLKAVPSLCRAMLSVLLCRENASTRGVLLRWPLPPSAWAIGLRYTIIGFCIYETL